MSGEFFGRVFLDDLLHGFAKQTRHRDHGAIGDFLEPTQQVRIQIETGLHLLSFGHDGKASIESNEVPQER